MVQKNYGTRPQQSCAGLLGSLSQGYCNGTTKMHFGLGCEGLVGLDSSGPVSVELALFFSVFHSSIFNAAGVMPSHPERICYSSVLFSLS